MPLLLSLLGSPTPLMVIIKFKLSPNSSFGPFPEWTTIHIIIVFLGKKLSISTMNLIFKLIVDLRSGETIVGLKYNL